jgi:hypothetical protein
LIEDAYTLGASLGLSVWCCDQAGPFQTVPCPGQQWQPEGQPARQPHEYLRNGTGKVLTLFQPADGQVRLQGVTACPNGILHGRLQQELTAILDTLSPAEAPADREALRALWERWQRGLTVKPGAPGSPADLVQLHNKGSVFASAEQPLTPRHLPCLPLSILYPTPSACAWMT